MAMPKPQKLGVEMTVCIGKTRHTQRHTCRLQLSQNLRDNPGFLALVLGPRKPYFSPIVCPRSRLDSYTISLHFYYRRSDRGIPRVEVFATLATSIQLLVM